jgi:hypothetical protein
VIVTLVDLAATRGKDVGRSVVHGWGRVTSTQRVLPNALIVGAQRCGTTALFRAVTAHPGASGPVVRKGVHYFDVDYTHPLEWYQGFFPLRATASRGVPAGQSPVVLEASPYYMFHPAVPGRIAKDLPGVKVVALLRDPVSRAHSAYKHEYSRGFETLSFVDALAAEDDRLAGEEEKLVSDPGYVSFAHQHQAYLARGRYTEQLERLEKAIGRDRILVLDSSEYFRQPDEGLHQVLEFLGLPPIPHEEVFRNESTGSGIDPDLRRRLGEQMAPHDERLRDWLGWTPSWMR